MVAALPLIATFITAAPDEVVRQLGVRTLPAHIIVSPDGRFFSVTGSTWDEQARRILASPLR